ncbi:MAG TPA: hypothetical protein VGF34_14630 [Stellaceae bacterium]
MPTRPAHMPPPAYRDRFRDEVRVTRAAFDAYASPRQQAEATRIAQRIEAFITCRNPLLQQRRAHLVEGHGDLRPEHVCLGSTPRIIDCLEFRADLRWLDPLQEIAFLAMECARLGAPAAIERIFWPLCQPDRRCAVAGAYRLLQGDRGIHPRPHRHPSPAG